MDADYQKVEVQLIIENSTNILWQSVTLRIDNDIISTKNEIPSDAKICFSFLTKPGTICFVTIQIVPILTTVVPQLFQPFTIQICGNTSIKISSSDNTICIERQFIITNETSQTFNTVTDGPLLTDNLSGRQLIPPKTSCTFIVFIPLQFINDEVSVLRCFCENGQSMRLATYKPLHGDSFNFTIQ